MNKPLGDPNDIFGDREHGQLVWACMTQLEKQHLVRLDQLYTCQTPVCDDEAVLEDVNPEHPFMSTVWIFANAADDPNPDQGEYHGTSRKSKCLDCRRRERGFRTELDLEIEIANL